MCSTTQPYVRNGFLMSFNVNAFFFFCFFSSSLLSVPLLVRNRQRASFIPLLNPVVIHLGEKWWKRNERNVERKKEKKNKCFLLIRVMNDVVVKLFPISPHFAQVFFFLQLLHLMRIQSLIVR